MAHFTRKTPKKPGQHRWIRKDETYSYTIYKCSGCGAEQKSWHAHPCRWSVWTVGDRVYQAKETKPICI